MVDSRFLEILEFFKFLEKFYKLLLIEVFLKIMLKESSCIISWKIN